MLAQCAAVPGAVIGAWPIGRLLAADPVGSQEIAAYVALAAFAARHETLAHRTASIEIEVRAALGGGTRRLFAGQAGATLMYVKLVAAVALAPRAGHDIDTGAADRPESAILTLFLWPARVAGRRDLPRTACRPSCCATVEWEKNDED